MTVLFCLRMSAPTKRETRFRSEDSETRQGSKRFRPSDTCSDERKYRETEEELIRERISKRALEVELAEARAAIERLEHQQQQQIKEEKMFVAEGDDIRGTTPRSVSPLPPLSRLPILIEDPLSSTTVPTLSLEVSRTDDGRMVFIDQAVTESTLLSTFTRVLKAELCKYHNHRHEFTSTMPDTQHPGSEWLNLVQYLEHIGKNEQEIRHRSWPEEATMAQQDFIRDMHRLRRTE